MKWMEGSPSVSITLMPYALDFSTANPDLLMAFMSGWTKHKLNNKDEKDPLVLHKAGVEEAIKIYQLGGVSVDKKMDKIIKMKEKGKFDDWLKKQINQ